MKLREEDFESVWVYLRTGFGFKPEISVNTKSLTGFEPRDPIVKPVKCQI